MVDSVQPMFPALSAPTQEAAAIGAEELLRPNPLHGREFLAHEFLLWLWFRTEHDFGAFDVPDGRVDLWFDDRLTFLAMEGERVVSAFNGGAPSTTPEAKLSILSGKVITEARLGMRRGEQEWFFLLEARAGEIQIKGLRVPAVIKDGGEEMVYERMYLLEIINRTLVALFTRFFEERSGEAWQASTLPSMQRWLLGGEP